MAIKKSTSATPAPEEETNEQPSEQTEVTPKEKPQPKVDEGLVNLWIAYDGNISIAEKSFIELAEYLQDNQIDRATCIVSIMKARGISYEAAQNYYGKVKKLLNNELVLTELKEGKITMKIARERTTTKQKNPAFAKPEAKEARYTNTLKSFVTAAKESGFSLREILVGVEAELRSAGIK